MTIAAEPRTRTTTSTNTRPELTRLHSNRLETSHLESNRRESTHLAPSTQRPRWPALDYLARYEWLSAARPGHVRNAAPAARRALAIAAAVVAPLLIGVLVGQPVDGVFAALGALLAGLASLQGVTRTRLTAVGVAGVGAAISTFVGATVAEAAPLALIPVVMVWGLVAGLAVSLGQRRSAVAVLWPVALIIAIGTPLDPAHAATRTGLVLAGAALQGLVVALSWAARRGRHERAALAASYRELAEYASAVARGTAQAPAPAPFPAAAHLADPNPLLSRATRSGYVAMLELAEQARAALASIAPHAAADPDARRFAAESADVLNSVANAVTARSGDIPALPTAPSVGAEWHWAANALLNDLRAIRELATHATSAHGPALTADVEAPALRTLRANLSPFSEPGRHALRLAVTAGIAEALVHLTGLYEGRWVVLTVFLVLRPDYTSTVARGVHRGLGTAAGALVGAGIVALLHPTPVALVLVGGVAVAVAYATFAVDYLLYSVFLTVFIVLLLDFIGVSANTTATARLTDTAIGAALALAAYAAWPTWHGRTAPRIFARLVETHQEYAAALLREVDTPGASSPARIRTLQSTARRARTDAEAAAARLAAEPPHPPFTAETARELVRAATRLARAELSLHTLVASAPASGADPRHARALVNATERALTELTEDFSRALRGTVG